MPKYQAWEEELDDPESEPTKDRDPEWDEYWDWLVNQKSPPLQANLLEVARIR